MLASIAKGFGGLLGDAVEISKDIYTDITDIPSAVSKGYDEGLIITPENTETEEPYAVTEVVEQAKPVVTMTESEADKELIRDLQSQIAQLNELKDVNQKIEE